MVNSDCLKQAKVIPVCKKEEKLDKSNYRPVKILPVISKIYERLIYDEDDDDDDDELFLWYG